MEWMLLYQMNEYNKLNSNYDKYKDSQNRKMNAIKNVFEENHSQINGLKEEIKDLKKEKRIKINQMENKIEQLETENKKIKNDLNSKIYDLEYQKRKADEKNRTLENQIYNLRCDYNSANVKNDELETKLNNLQYNYNYTNNYQMNRINELQQENSRLKTNYENFIKSEQVLRNKNNELENRCNNLYDANNSIRKEFDDLSKNFNQLKKKQREEERKKLEKEQKLQRFKETFKNDTKEIENRNITESKKYIFNYILNEFIKNFNENAPKNNLNNSLIKTLSEFTKNFAIQCKAFSEYFKAETLKIIQNYKVNESNIKIEHINFIVIGQTGVGKSTLINESLLLEGNQRADEGKGLPITNKSCLYYSEKLELIRMWDTEGINYEVSQNDILNEIKRLVDKGLAQGVDNYINVILYCVTGDRFQKADAQLIKEIMEIYPMDNLPVIITQLQAYDRVDANEMDKIIRKILEMFLDTEIVNKIEITSVVSRDKKEIKARGIPELFYKSLNMMGRAITSATCKKISQDIEQLCKSKILLNEKLNYLDLKIKDEIEVLKQIKYHDIKEDDDYFKVQPLHNINLSQENFYNGVNNINYYENNFQKMIATKFLDIYNNLNNTNYSLEDEERSQILKYILDILNKIKNAFNNYINENYRKKIHQKLFEKYYKELRKQQIRRSQEFNISEYVLKEDEIELNFEEKLFNYFKDIFFKYYICSIIELCINGIKSNIIENNQKILNEEQSIMKNINIKAENILKFISKELKEKLMKKINKYFRNINNNAIINDSNDKSKIIKIQNSYHQQNLNQKNNIEINPSISKKASDYINGIYDKFSSKEELKKNLEKFSINNWRFYYPANEPFFSFKKGEIYKDQIRIKNQNDIHNIEIYEGEMNNNNMKHGNGTLTTPLYVLKGTWRNDEFTGWGIKCMRNGDNFEGKYINGKLNGKGIFKNSKNLYKGDFIDNVRYGKGELITENYHYIGELKITN